MKEKWKDVIGYEGLYKISNLGNLKSSDGMRKNSLGHERFIKGKIISGYIDQDGYRRVILYPNLGDWRKRKKHYIHRLMAETFFGKQNGVVRHLDGNPSNNKIDNLKWGTPKENSKDRSDHGRTYKHPKGAENMRAVLTKEKVKNIISERHLTQEFLAKKYGVSRTTIYRVLKGIRYV